MMHGPVVGWSGGATSAWVHRISLIHGPLAQWCMVQWAGRAGARPAQWASEPKRAGRLRCLASVEHGSQHYTYRAGCAVGRLVHGAGDHWARATACDEQGGPWGKLLLRGR